MIDKFMTYEDGDWVRAKSVPIFDENERDGIVYDAEALNNIVNNNNRRIADTGDLTPLVIGHSPDNVLEREKEVVGWAENFHLGDWGQVEPRKCVFADLKFTRDGWDRAKNFPRRSAEVWDSGTEHINIDPIALLSASTPYRDLGLLFSKNVNRNNIYDQPPTGDVMEKDELMKLFSECLKNSDMGKWCAKKMEAEGAEDKPKDMEEEDKDDKPKENDAEEKEDKEGAEEDKEKVKNERDQMRRKFARLEDENKALFARLAEVERKERLAVRKSELIGLEGEGFNFDINEELDNVVDLAPAAYEKHVSNIRKNYARVPVGVRIPVRDVPASGLNLKVNFTQEDTAKAAEFIRTGKAKTAEEALNLLRGTK